MKPSQTEHILLLLVRDGMVSNFYCIENKITLRLAARVKDLRNKGYWITSHKQKNKDCIYKLESLPVNAV
jgi:hypothetical protein